MPNSPENRETVEAICRNCDAMISSELGIEENRCTICGARGLLLASVPPVPAEAACGPRVSARA
jgi:DNA-directed RNA polymerase subunit RPC12/RpoP